MIALNNLYDSNNNLQRYPYLLTHKIIVTNSKQSSVAQFVTKLINTIKLYMYTHWYIRVYTCRVQLLKLFIRLAWLTNLYNETQIIKTMSSLYLI